MAMSTSNSGTVITRHRVGMDCNIARRDAGVDVVAALVRRDRWCSSRSTGMYTFGPKEDTNYILGAIEY